ncbi:MAG TPA: ferric aerobactin receptor, partial [Bacteroidetes bacterium]|nr:ferric aerobactin receptor [Bacteroidota bacterium]
DNLEDQFSPRLSISYSFAPRWSFNANTGIYYQLPAYTTLGYRDNSGTLVNAENGLTYIRNDQIVAGFEFRPDAGSRVSVEGFYKKYSGYPFNLRDSISLANLGADFGIVGDAPVSSTGEGLAYGVEFLAQQKLKKGFYGIVAYTLVVSEFEDKNGDLIPSAWDSR